MQPIFSTDEPHHLKTNEFPLGKYNTKLLWNSSSSRITSRCRGCPFTLHSVMLFLLQFYLANHYIPMYHCLQSDKLQSVKCPPPQKEKGKISKIRLFQPPFTCQFSDCTEKLLKPSTIIYMSRNSQVDNKSAKPPVSSLYCTH